MTAGALLLVVLAAAPAAPGEPAATATTEPTERWYGGTAVAIDAGALASVVGGVALGGKLGAGLVVAGVTAGVFVAPLHHDWAGHPDRLSTSLALRGGAFAVGLATFIAVGRSRTCAREFPAPSCDGLETFAFLAPIAVAMLIDDAILSHGPVAPAAPRKAAGWRARPTLLLAGAGLVGWF